MSVTDTSVDRHIFIVRRHHVRWAIVIGVLLVGAICIAAFYLGGGNVGFENGTAVVTQPDLETLRNRVQVQTRPPGAAQSVVVQTRPVPAPTSFPDGVTRSRIDEISTETQRLQRAETRTDRYDPIDRLANTVTALADTVRTTNRDTNEAIQVVGRQVTTLVGDVTSLDRKVTGLDGRITALEARPVAQVAPQAVPVETAPASAVQPTVAPAQRPAPLAQAEDSRRPVGGRQMDLDRSTLPGNWNIGRVNDQEKAERCASGKLRISTDPRTFTKLPNGGLRRPLVCVE